MIYSIDKPDLTKATTNKLYEKILESDNLQECLIQTETPEYLYWDRARYKEHPKNMTAEEFWAAVKLFRRHSSNRTTTPILNENKSPFTWQSLPEQERFLHDVDLHLGGELSHRYVDEEIGARKLISRGVMEEAIASSQLEGANTTRRVAKEMLQERRKPRNTSEQMILNNYQTMIAIEEELKRESLSEGLILDLHARLTKGTIDDRDVGTLRSKEERILVSNPVTGMIYHIPPSREFVDVEIKRLVDYANDRFEERRFTHPVVKAIFIHFWIGYLHPFVDGNGRLGRALFYWYCLRHDYWALTFLPLSKAIKGSPAQYRDAYVYTEQDDNDLTYFLDYNIRKIKLARREFESYLRRLRRDIKKLSEVAGDEHSLNNRQIQLLRYLYKNSDVTTTIKTHALVYNVSRPTARKDLEELEEMGFLASTRIGNERPFRAGPKLKRLPD